MSYGHANNLARHGQVPSPQTPPAGPPPETATASQPGTLVPGWYTTPDLAPVLTGHDIGALYRWLTAAGMSQHRIAALAGTTQSQVADIIAGRRSRVMAYDVLARTAEGLSIPRERMGLSFWGPDGRWYGPEGAYPGGVTVADPAEGVDEEMRRRALLAAGAVSALGWPLLGDVPQLPAPTAQPLPSRLGTVHVDSVADLLSWLRAWARTYGGQADMVGAAADRSLALLTVPGDDTLRARLASVLAELHTEAGWTYFDSGADDLARHYFCLAMDLARRFGDRYQVANALRHAGMVPLERNQLDDALKLFQFGQITFLLPGGELAHDDPRVPPMIACLNSLQARALARMDRPELARSKLAASRDGWQPPDTFAQADADYRNAEVSLRLGQIETAEQFITQSARAWGPQDRRPAASTAILRATIHLHAGEPSGLRMAHDAITLVTKLSSIRARRRLGPLAQTLETRPGTDARDLARMARQAAA